MGDPRDRILALLHSKTGKIVFSIILGLGVAALFNVACKNNDCVVLKAPDHKSYEDAVYHHGDNCYKFTLKTTECSGETVNA